MELLSPAGGMEAACAALSCGADAIYLGLGDFNARRNAENFTFDDLRKVCRLAHLGGQRVYLTVNTALKTEEMEAALELIATAWVCGIDAVIVQDLGLLSCLSQSMPEVAVHASTQMNIHDSHGVKLMNELGCSRVTLARELSVDEIARLSELGVELEVFGHGALCVCYSGQCLMSSLIGQRSANRGLCAQACRLPYELVDSDGNLEADPASVGRYLLSPKDLSTIDILDRLVDAGASSLKVEGRMKSPEYVATVTSIYRAAIDRAEGSGDYAASQSERDDLAEAFSRGFTTAYLEDDRTMRMMGPKRPNNRGVRVGRVQSLSGGYVALALDKDVAVGDVLEYWTSRGAVPERVEALYMDGREVDSAPAGSTPRLVVSRPVAPGDRVFRVQNSRLADQARASYEGFCGRKREVRFTVRCVIGEPLFVALEDESGRRGEAFGPAVEPARTKAVEREAICEHVGRLGGTPYVAIAWDVELDEGAGVGFSLLHRLRREAIEAYEEALLTPYTSREKPRVEVHEPAVCAQDSSPLLAVVCSPANARVLADAYRGDPVVRIDVPATELAYGSEHDVTELSAALDSGAALRMPTICHDAEASRYLQFVQPGSIVVADSVSMLDRCARIGAIVEAGPHIPLWNPPALDAVARLGATRVWMSPELSLAELEGIAALSPVALGICVRGHQELMVTEHCQLMAIGPCNQMCATCPRRSRRHYLRDRKGYEFPVMSDATGRTHLYNAVSFDGVPNIPTLVRAGMSSFSVDVALMDASEALRCVNRCREALVNGTQFDRIEGSTTGNLFRPVA